VTAGPILPGDRPSGLAQAGRKKEKKMSHLDAYNETVQPGATTEGEIFLGRLEISAAFVRYLKALPKNGRFHMSRLCIVAHSGAAAQDGTILRPGEFAAVATNGFSLVSITLQGSPDFSTLPKSVLDAVRRCDVIFPVDMISKGAFRVYVRPVNDLNVQAWALNFAKSDAAGLKISTYRVGEWIPINHVRTFLETPASIEYRAPRFKVNPSRLAQVCSIVEHVGKEEASCVLHFPAEVSQPMRITRISKDGVNVAALLMGQVGGEK